MQPQVELGASQSLEELFALRDRLFSRLTTDNIDHFILVDGLIDLLETGAQGDLDAA